MRQEQKMENIGLAKHGHRNIRLASHQPHHQTIRLASFSLGEAFVLQGTTVLRVDNATFFLLTPFLYPSNVPWK